MLCAFSLGAGAGWLQTYFGFMFYPDGQLLFLLSAPASPATPAPPVLLPLLLLPAERSRLVAARSRWEPCVVVRALRDLGRPAHQLQRVRRLVHANGEAGSRRLPLLSPCGLGWKLPRSVESGAEQRVQGSRLRGPRYPLRPRPQYEPLRRKLWEYGARTVLVEVHASASACAVSQRANFVRSVADIA